MDLRQSTRRGGGEGNEEEDEGGEEEEEGLPRQPSRRRGLPPHNQGSSANYSRTAHSGGQGQRLTATCAAHLPGTQRSTLIQHFSSFFSTFRHFSCGNFSALFSLIITIRTQCARYLSTSVVSF